MFKRYLILIWFLFPVTMLQAQDRAYVHDLVKRLSSPGLHGRGYVKSGDKKAARLLENEMQKAGLTAFGNSYSQPYHFPINTFPGTMEMRVGKRKLNPGYDFVLSPSIGSIDETFSLFWLPDTVTTIAAAMQFIDTTSVGQFVVVAPSGFNQAYREGIPGAKGVIQLTKGNVWWHVSGARNPNGRLALMVREDALPRDTRTFSLKVKAEFVDKHETQNLAAYVRGCVEPDTFVVFVAHYDHLGRMGSRTYFPGANDNASGTATVLDLGRFYAKNPSKAYYSMAFILVSGEEAGLMGSSYNADNPLFPLEKIKFLINMDMVGTGSEGLSVVNGKQFPFQMALLDSLNQQKNYFLDIRAGGESCNSDHCPYYKKGVPSFFIFTRGSENREYHNVYDTYNRLPFTSYEQLFGILTDFTEALEPGHNH